MDTLVDLATQRLHTHGGRMTTQRRIILEALDYLGCHPTAEEIFVVVNQRDPTVNLSTIYRTLRWLEQEGLISARRFDESRRQERFDAVLPVEHHHFQCTVCKNVIEFDHPSIQVIKAQFAGSSGCQVQSASMMLYGLCPQCRQSQPASREPERGNHS
jgi:Fe2+ or Zn2+ uptake regulation protein